MKTRTRTIDQVMDEFFDTDEEHEPGIRDSYDAWAALERAEDRNVFEDLADMANTA